MEFDREELELISDFIDGFYSKSVGMQVNWKYFNRVQRLKTKINTCLGVSGDEKQFLTEDE